MTHFRPSVSHGPRLWRRYTVRVSCCDRVGPGKHWVIAPATPRHPKFQVSKRRVHVLDCWSRPLLGRPERVLARDTSVLVPGFLGGRSTW